MRDYRSPDGTNWKVVVKLPSHSSAMLTFLHPDGRTSMYDRYTWLNVAGATASNPRERLSAQALLDGLTDETIARLFGRSMMVSGNRDLINMT